jgi:hypothetical protein
VSRGPSRRVLRCPAQRRALSFGLLIGVLAGCQYVPRAVEGVPVEAPWAALPLRAWLAENRAEPEALALCRPPDCGPGLAVAVVRVSGAEREAAEAVLQHPDRLARALEGPGGKTRPVATVASATPIREADATGFVLSLGRRDGSKPPAFGAALGRRHGGDLRIVLAIGEDAGHVEAAARRVARQHLEARGPLSSGRSAAKAVADSSRTEAP